MKSKESLKIPEHILLFETFYKNYNNLPEDSKYKNKVELLGI